MRDEGSLSIYLCQGKEDAQYTILHRATTFHIHTYLLMGIIEHSVPMRLAILLRGPQVWILAERNWGWKRVLFYTNEETSTNKLIQDTKVSYRSQKSPQKNDIHLLKKLLISHPKLKQSNLELSEKESKRTLTNMLNKSKTTWMFSKKLKTAEWSKEVIRVGKHASLKT